MYYVGFCVRACDTFRLRFLNLSQIKRKPIFNNLSVIHQLTMSLVVDCAQETNIFFFFLLLKSEKILHTFTSYISIVILSMFNFWIGFKIKKKKNSQNIKYATVSDLLVVETCREYWV